MHVLYLSCVSKAQSKRESLEAQRRNSVCGHVWAKCPAVAFCGFKGRGCSFNLQKEKRKRLINSSADCNPPRCKAQSNSVCVAEGCVCVPARREDSGPFYYKTITVTY